MASNQPATVIGRVSGPGVTDFSGVQVYLYDTVSGSVLVPAAVPPVAADGTYSIANVPPGRWRVACWPPPDMPLMGASYHAMPLFNPIAGTALRLLAGQTATADFVLQPAGKLQVLVTDQAQQPVTGATVMTGLATARFLATAPKTTDASGAAVFANVPLASKIAVLGPSGFASAFYPSGTLWDNATIVTIPTPPGALSVPITLPPG